MIERFWRLRNNIFFLRFALFAAAALPRLAGLGRYITPDELIWVFRSVQFQQAVAARQWADSLVSGHPGVTTTWLATLGIRLQILFQPADRAVYDWITHLAFFMPDNMAAFSQLATFLTAVRLVIILVNSLGVVAVYGLARPLFGHFTALLAAFLLALDPFVVGLSGLLHVDALMTTFATLALLALLGAIRPEYSTRRRRGYAALSGLLAAGAVLTKTPALLLTPLAGLFFFFSLFFEAGGEGNGYFGFAQYGRWLNWKLPNWKSADWRSTLSCAIIWLVVFLAAIFVAYPALWGAPGAAFSLLSGNASRHIGSALRPSFFLGEVAYDHGPLFYPVVLAFRLSPVVLVGLVLAVFMALRRDGHFGLRPSVAAQRWRFCQWSCPAVWLLLLWVALFIGGISFAAKKFDRYALAVIPALTILAALAWTQLSDRLPRWGRYAGPGLVVVQAAYLSVFLPYPLAAYNPLLGGPAVAQKALPIGWGEAIGAAAHWLAEQPGMAGKTAVAGIAPSFAPFFPGQTLLSYPENQAQADYIILTANGRQTSPDGTILSDDFTLLHTVLYGGLEQAWIYVQPNPQKPDLTLTDLSNPVAFDNRVRLLATQAVVSGERLDFYARWQLLAGGEDGRYTLKLTLRDSEGRAWAKREIELVNETYFYPQHWSPDEMPQIRYALDLPPGLPPAQYELELALFDSDGAQMPVLAGDGAFQGVVYPAADIVTSSLIGGDLDIPVTAEPGASVAVWLDGGLTLLGHSVVPEAIINGGTAVIDLYWQANAALPGGVALTLSLGDEVVLSAPLSRYDSGQWRPGERIHEKVSMAVPPQMAAGTYPLQLHLFDEAGAPLAETAVPMGRLEIIATDRLFTLPDAIQIPLDYRFGDDIRLRGLDWPDGTIVAVGDTVQLTLYWQTEAKPEAKPETQPADLVSAFVHLVGPDDGNIAQDDRWPGGLPSDTWAEGQVIVDEYVVPLPPDAPPGVYRVAVGLYTAANGLRLPATDGDGTAVPDNRVILPIALTVETAP